MTRISAPQVKTGHVYLELVLEMSFPLVTFRARQYRLYVLMGRFVQMKAVGVGLFCLWVNLVN